MKRWRTIQNEIGITLAELLATLALITIVSGVIFSIIISSINNSNSVDKSNDLNNKANQIMFQLTNIHQNSVEYTLQYNVADRNSLTFKYRNPTETNEKEINVDLKNYELVMEVNGDVITTDSPKFIDLTDSNNLTINVNLQLIGFDDNSRNNEVSLKTTISRMTPAREEGLDE